MIPNIKLSKKNIYLDHAATTPLDLRVKKAMEPFWSHFFGNPTSLYKQGREARAAVSLSRQTIADLIGSKSQEIVFTAGGTESINAAIFGVAKKYKVTKNFKPHFISSVIEHHAVLHSLQALAGEGYAVTSVGVDGEGFIDLAQLKASVKKETVLISVMIANNEIGTIQPVAEIGKWLRGLNAERVRKKLHPILFHTDACQAGGVMDLHVHKLGVDLMSVNASKMYGPKQTGFLFVRLGVDLEPFIYGGGQEYNIRSGTENVPGIVGLAKSFELAQKEMVKENTRLQKLRDFFITEVLKKVPKAILNGPDERPQKKMGPMKRLPNNVNISFSGIRGEDLLLYLDSYNISVSTGSACTSTLEEPSHVITALGSPATYIQGAMRFTLGKETAKKELDYVLGLLPELVKEIRKVKSVIS